MWDRYEKEFIFDHGWTINKENKIEITGTQFKNYQYTGRSIHDKTINTLMIPSIHGCALIFEHKHFEII